MSIKDIGDGWLRFLMVRFFNKELPEKTKKIVEERFNICISCDSLKEITNKYSKTKFRFCSICKCSFPGMIFSSGKKCPKGKWNSMDNHEIY